MGWQLPSMPSPPVMMASALLKDGLRIELWCGSRKVGDIPPMPEKV
jgi:hypothetical protein